jgi:NADPH2:quinone reductase
VPQRRPSAADNVEGEAGACLGIPALTALHAVLMDGVTGRTVLVARGAGAVGHYGCSYSCGCGVIAGRQRGQAELARAAGADVI